MYYNKDKGESMYNLKRYKKFFSILASMLLITLVFKVTTTDGPSAEVGIELEVESDQLVAQLIKVHLDGAVKNPGVYELEDGARLEDAIKMAGGLVEDANDEFLNYAKLLEDGEKITVLHKKIVAENRGEVAVPTYEESSYTVLEKLNYMSVEEYQNLPGVGEKISGEIIDYRDSIGSFSSVEELKNVSGIGEAKYAKIIDFLQ